MLDRTSTAARWRAGSVAVAAVAALVAAGCGSSATTSTQATNAGAAASTASSSSAAPAASTASSSAAGAGVTVKTAKGPAGTYLTDGAGRALYLWVADSKGKSVCSGACAGVWPPLVTKGAPSASGGAKAAALGTFTRSDGSKQVTYDGHPLYYYAADTKPGQTTGQGSDSFGAKWWLVTPAGASITTGGSGGSGATSGASSSGSSSGGWG